MRPFIILHPASVEAIARADARAQWYAQHRANRIARRDGTEPKQIHRVFTAETGEYLGVRIVRLEEVLITPPAQAPAMLPEPTSKGKRIAQWKLERRGRW